MFDRLFLIEKGEYKPLNQYQREVIIKSLKKCSNIPNININEINFYWCSELDDRCINAAFVQYKPNSIFIRSISNPFNNIPQKLKVPLSEGILKRIKKSYESNIIDIVPHVAHELVHINQYRKYGKILYSICSMPLLYSTMLDKKAFAIEKSTAIDLNLSTDLYGKSK